MPKPESMQDAYNKIRTYFSRPDAVIAVSETTDYGSRCLYKTEEGNKCAIGCLLSDDEYDERFEGLNASEVVGMLGWEFMSSFGHSLDVIQHIHDHSETAKEFVNKLDKYATKHSLKVPS